MHLNRSDIVSDARIHPSPARVDGDFSSDCQHLEGRLLVCSLP